VSEAKPGRLRVPLGKGNVVLTRDKGISLRRGALVPHCSALHKNIYLISGEGQYMFEPRLSWTYMRRTAFHLVARSKILFKFDSTSLAAVPISATPMEKSGLLAAAAMV